VTHLSYFEFAARAKAIGFRKTVPGPVSLPSVSTKKRRKPNCPAAILGTVSVRHATGSIDDITAQHHTHFSMCFQMLRLIYIF
jgi:hypothetical protein